MGNFVITVESRLLYICHARPRPNAPLYQVCYPLLTDRRGINLGIEQAMARKQRLQRTDYQRIVSAGVGAFQKIAEDALALRIEGALKEEIHFFCN
jgi:hypothetical protein